MLWLVVGGFAAVLAIFAVQGYIRAGKVKTIAECTPAEQPSARRGWVSPKASGGGLGLGLLAVVGGVFLHSHFQPLAQVCQSGLGVLGQAVSSNAQTDCSLDHGLAEFGTFMSIGGGVIVILTVLLVLVLVFDGYRQGRK